MRIARIDLFRYTLPLVAPLALRGVTLHRRDGLLFRLTSDTGAVGWGEAAPLSGFSRETLAEATAAAQQLRDRARGHLVTVDGVDPAGVLQDELDTWSLPASVWFGFELAVCNLYGAAHNLTLPQVLGEPSRSVVSLNSLLVGDEDLLPEARRMRQAGYRAIKLKVGRRSIEEDIECVRSLCDELNEQVALRLDANRAWTWDEAAAFARGVAGCPIEYIEEPLADPAQLPAFARQVSLPVALDESLQDLPREALHAHVYARAIVFKPTLRGGFVHVQRLADQATRLGITPVLSAAFESGLGLLGLVALAAHLGTDDVSLGLDTYRHLQEDVLVPRPSLEGPHLDVPALFQPTYTIREDRLTPITAASVG